MTPFEALLPPAGTIGVGVVDGGHGDVSSAAEMIEAARDYFHRCGVKTSAMSLPPMGSTTGEIAISVASGVFTAVLLHYWTRAKMFAKDIAGRKFKREVSKRLKYCLIQIQDNRGETRDAVELLLLLPGLHQHLATTYPNRDYSFSVTSGMPSGGNMHIKLEQYDSLASAVRQASKVIMRMPTSPNVFVHLEDGPFGSRHVKYNAV